MSRTAFEYYRDLILVLVVKDLKVRYKSTFLGYAWSVLHPLAFAMVFFFVFRIVMRIQIENFALFLIAGLFPWQWLSNSLMASNSFFLGNSSLIRKVKFPRSVLALAGVLNDAVHFVISIPVILLFMLFYRVSPTVSWFWGIPLLAAIQLLLTFGISLLVASLNLFFRDMERLTAILTMLLFYMTPVVYPVSMLPERMRWLLYANPLAPIIVAWRRLFLEGRVELGLAAIALGVALPTFGLGYAVYRSLEWRFAEIV
jgi:lipopolysaccharide transport system permease protein